MTANVAVDAATRDGTTASDQPAGDHRARFEKEAIPYMRQMFPTAMRLTGDRCDAEDLIQETFARAYAKFHQFVPGTNLRAWLYCIMFRTFYSACRKQRRRPAEVLSPDLYRAAECQARHVPPSRSAEAEALAGASESAVMRALAELPPQFKAVLYLSDIEGYQQGDIAAIMGTPVGTVMSRIHRGRRMLAAKLRPLTAAPAGLAPQPPVTRPPAAGPEANQAGPASGPGPGSGPEAPASRPAGLPIAA